MFSVSENVSQQSLPTFTHLERENPKKPSQFQGLPEAFELAF